MIVKTKNDMDRAAVGGVVAGLAAGSFLTLVMTAVSWANGRDVWYGIKGAAAPLLGERAMLPGFDFGPVALGMLAHLFVSVAWAVSFACLFYGLGKAATMAAGVLWGVVVCVGMYAIVLPALNLGAMVHEVSIARALVFHMIYAVPMAAIFLEYQREQRLTRHVFA